MIQIMLTLALFYLKNHRKRTTDNVNFASNDIGSNKFKIKKVNKESLTKVMNVILTCLETDRSVHREYQIRKCFKDHNKRENNGNTRRFNGFNQGRFHQNNRFELYCIRIKLISINLHIFIINI
jgi:hypothetical protein